ncbi:MAG TPA: iron-sulfur cluster assembly accessory protein [Candidatus Nanoarchaeia archaeon]|nr:iron-sulfur cluster assembly accessory protein [Candidatus Nanoarchaeia archaeon]
MEAKPINKEMIISEIIVKHPEVTPLLMEMGIHCVGCHVSGMETLEMGFRGHGMTDEVIDEAVRQLNDAVEVKEESKSGHLTVTSTAAKKVKEIGAKSDKKALRIAVKAGGCSGFMYDMELVDEKEDGDFEIKDKGITIFVDKESMRHIDGAEVDYVDSLQGAGFKVSNPKAKKTCGCGESFG